ncbi:hypothetical protein [Bacillus pakistanensis]|uniref:hypothetical protein n=1 Tax=Rossellomorea pakistanensis TaxID=992288 RepID=UPI001962B8E5|nr:hypothetical protein [Bacillus pakistanensis]
MLNNEYNELRQALVSNLIGGRYEKRLDFNYRRIIIGLIISFFTLEYNGWTYIRHNKLGEIEKVIKEIDFNLVTNHTTTLRRKFYC